MRKRDDPIPAIVWYAKKKADISDIPEVISIIFVILVVAIVAYLAFSGKFKEWDNTRQYEAGCVHDQR